MGRKEAICDYFERAMEVAELKIAENWNLIKREKEKSLQYDEHRNHYHQMMSTFAEADNFLQHAFNDTREVQEAIRSYRSLTQEMKEVWY